MVDLTFHDRDGSTLEFKQWLDIAVAYGMGIPLAETTMPHELGDITIRTVWLGITEDEGRCKQYLILRGIRGRRWTCLEMLDKEEDARANHHLWCLRAVGAT